MHVAEPGSSVEQVAAFIRGMPKPPKPLCKRFFAILTRERFEKSKELLIYSILDVKGGKGDEIQLTSVPCPAYLAAEFFVNFDRYPMLWDSAVKEQGVWCGAGAEWPDDGDVTTNLMALILLDEFPVETINKVLQDNRAEWSGLWLADTYEGLPDVRPTHRLLATKCPIDSSWRSPFVGNSIEDAANFVRNAPKPPKPLTKSWFAVMQKQAFEKNGRLLICKILPIGGEVDLSENEEDRTEQFREDGMSLMCRIQSDKQQKVGDDSVKGEDEGEFELQMLQYEAGELGNWNGSDDAKYWWLN